MANEIKLKRGSGSDPTASDLAVGGQILSKQKRCLINISSYVSDASSAQFRNRKLNDCEINYLKMCWVNVVPTIMHYVQLFMPSP